MEIWQAIIIAFSSFLFLGLVLMLLSLCNEAKRGRTGGGTEGHGHNRIIGHTAHTGFTGHTTIDIGGGGGGSVFSGGGGDGGCSGGGGDGGGGGGGVGC